MSDSAQTHEKAKAPGLGRWLQTWWLGLLPLALLGILVWVFLTYGPVGVFRADLPPVEELSIQRIVLTTNPREIRVHVTNGGPDSVTIAQVLVDEAYWTHTMDSGRTISRLGRTTITIPYDWIEGDQHEITLISSTGATFSSEIEVATETPRANARYLTTFTLLGTYAGVIPVFLGLLWLPFIRRLKQQWINFFLALTVGLLLFLGVDSVVEGLEVATERVPAAFQGISLLLIGAVGTFAALMAISQRTATAQRDSVSGRLLIAYFIALGIGFHNLGEGLALGTAYSLGNVALGSLLVVGFAVHNTTEGLAIVTPVSRDRPKLRHLILLGSLAGVPTIAGAWIGGLTFYPELSTLFLGMGAGAIFQVIYQIGKLMLKDSREKDFASLAAVGLIAGLVIMYLTGLLVVTS